MVSGNDPSNVYGLKCIRCGSALELPADPNALYCDCRFCGQDNVFPPHIIEARQRGYALEVERRAVEVDRQARERADAERAAVRTQKSRTLLILLGVGAFSVVALVAVLLVIGIFVSRAEQAEKLRAADPKVSGQAQVLALIQKMRAESGCDRILLQPETHRKEAGKVSLDMIAGDHCVHILGATGTGTPISMKYTGRVALTRPLPAPGTSVDYRLCASETAEHAFELTTVDEPFTVAALECPRLPSEGGSRSKPGDPVTSGKTTLAKRLAALTVAGCDHLVADTTVARGNQSFTITSPANAACYNLLVGSYFRDVAFTIALSDPNGNAMPVPAPSREIRLVFCSQRAGDYKLSITPSTPDHYAYASVDCPRFGPEGLRRERELRGLPLKKSTKAKPL